MKPNVGRVDAVLRWIVAMAAFTCSVAFNDRPVPSLGFALLGLIMAATALTRTCPLYDAVGINTTGQLPAARRGVS
jgi:hypothetical protein